MSTDSSDTDTADSSGVDISAEPEVIDPNQYRTDGADEDGAKGKNNDDTQTEEHVTEDEPASEEEEVEVDDPETPADEEEESDEDPSEAADEEADDVPASPADDVPGEGTDESADDTDDEAEESDDDAAPVDPTEGDDDPDGSAGGAGVTAAGETQTVAEETTASSQATDHPEPDSPSSPVESDEAEESAPDPEGASDQSDTEDTEAAEQAETDSDDLLDPISVDVSGFPSRWEARTDAGSIETILDATEALVDEAKVYLTDDELVLQAVDAANVAIAQPRLSASAFESWDTDGGVIGVELNRFAEVIGMADSKSSDVRFELDPDTRKLTIYVDDIEYTLGLINPDTIRESPGIPDLDLEGEVVLEHAEFHRAIKGADLIASMVRFGVDMDGPVFTMEASGDTDDVILELADDEVKKLSPAPADSVFDLSYLKDIRKAIPGKRSDIHLALGSDHPLKVYYEFSDGHGSVLYMLAPKIQD